MRIALCYSGQPRDFIHAVDNHREHFGLGQVNVDVFGHKASAGSWVGGLKA